MDANLGDALASHASLDSTALDVSNMMLDSSSVSVGWSDDEQLVLDRVLDECFEEMERDELRDVTGKSAVLLQTFAYSGEGDTKKRRSVEELCATALLAALNVVRVPLQAARSTIGKSLREAVDVVRRMPRRKRKRADYDEDSVEVREAQERLDSLARRLRSTRLDKQDVALELAMLACALEGFRAAGDSASARELAAALLAKVDAMNGLVVSESRTMAAALALADGPVDLSDVVRALHQADAPYTSIADAPSPDPDSPFSDTIDGWVHYNTPIVPPRIPLPRTPASDQLAYDDFSHEPLPPSHQSIEDIISLYDYI